MVKASGSFSRRTPGDLGLGTTGHDVHAQFWVLKMMSPLEGEKKEVETHIQHHNCSWINMDCFLTEHLLDDALGPRTIFYLSYGWLQHAIVFVKRKLLSCENLLSLWRATIGSWNHATSKVFFVDLDGSFILFSIFKTEFLKHGRKEAQFSPVSYTHLTLPTKA